LNRNPSEEALHISYTELHQRVCKMANVLREQGVEKEIVCIYLPMIPELAIATLACARIGAYILLFSLDFQHQQWPLE
jgi:acetyl-CoA synthetase